MRNFKQHYQLVNEFFDDIEGAVRHIDHLEEGILNKGKQGVKEAIAQIDASISYFIDDSDYKISTKFDGSPAIVAGVDVNGKFFVSTKSFFNTKEERIICYTAEEINDYFIKKKIENNKKNKKPQPELAEKLRLALEYLPSLNLTGIYQMDYMFDNRIKDESTPATIDGVANENKFITFRPNPSGIIYAVYPDSPYGQQIIDSKIGVAIHIEYVVKNGILKVKKYTSSPDEFSPSKTVFLFNTLVNKQKNVKSQFGKLLLRDVNKKKNTVLKLADTVDFSGLDNYKTELKTYINKEVSVGRFLENPKLSANEFIDYMTIKLKKEIENVDKEIEAINAKIEKDGEDKRTVNSRTRKFNKKNDKTEKMNKDIAELKALKPSIQKAFQITRLIAVLKNNLIKIFNEITKNDLLGTYVPKSDEEPNAWMTTVPEGFALSRVGSSEDESPVITKMIKRVGDADSPGFSEVNFRRRASGATNPTT